MNAPRSSLRLGAVAAGWLALGMLGARHLAFHLPDAIASALSEPSYYALVWSLTTALGVAAVFRLDPAPRDALALGRPSASALTLAGLVAPIVLVVSLYLAWRIALPSIQAELAARGKQAMRAAVSSANRAARQPNLGTVVLWSVVLTPLAEELVFRGALWSAIARAVAPPTETAPPSLAPKFVVRSPLGDGLTALVRLLRGGLLATLVTSLLFAWLHVEGDGGVALLALVQTALLGLALGLARGMAGSIAAPVTLHAAFNALTLAQKRGLFAGTFWPAPLPIPSKLWFVALACAFAVALVVTLRARHPKSVASPPSEG
ncbi:MAG: CPBP family intramembrane metalloprotease [Deltaproteobacteria bacterium]|nr:CPBP family intramembrane metalloprotease [Deltaproteobacteria bacterium]